jgi:hypothetical protein
MKLEMKMTNTLKKERTHQLKIYPNEQLNSIFYIQGVP